MIVTARYRRVGDPASEWEPLEAASFGASRWGVRRFDYDKDPSRLTTHTPDIERITALAGVVGSTLSGVPSNQEPAKVTTDGIPGAELDLAGSVAQGFTVAYSAQWDVLHKSGINLYFLAKPNGTTDSEYVLSTVSGFTTVEGMYLRYEGNNSRYAIHMTNGADDVFGAVRISSPGSFPTGARHLVGVHYDATGVHYSKNGVLIGSNSAVVNPYGTGAASAAEIAYLNSSVGVTAARAFNGIAERLWAYQANKHSASAMLEFNELVNAFYGHDPFGKSRWGTRQLHYDFNPELLETHNPDVERITKNNGIFGGSLTGTPNDLEPRLVTQDGAKCAFNPNPEDAEGQRLYDPNTATAFGPYETIHSLGSTPYALYLLLRVEFLKNLAFWLSSCASTQTETGFFLRTSADGSIYFSIGNSSGATIAEVLSAGSVIAAATWYHVCVRWNGSGASTPTLELLVNNVVVASSTTVSDTPATGAPTLDFALMGRDGTSGRTVRGHLALAQLYSGVDHSQSNLTGEHYNVSKDTYTGFSLP